ncbi:stage V sporulation protein B [Paenibacillus sp. UNCCL117]|uniref:stage V sporulation protein B n=1 Tax=unclassified Paenibacillus TaxID=185978 RepID=UPI0008819117|nr:MULTISPECIES: stage V sporulation protein B [unclassified Paenibacillus]SDE60174.1 stage V sporulation protein B [Paenibacillus sp. cl123]SFW69469.1 stage V sporulation protein B [Paenibacillus sp. UNCCL117]
MTKQTFIKGTMILLAAGIINRILGFIPRMALPRVIGAEGIGLYQMGWPFLVVILTVVTGGIPVAVAKLVAAAEAEGNEARVRSIFRIALTLAGTLGLAFTGIILFGARWITDHLFTDPRVYYTFLCMTPIVPLVAVSSVYRGYFQGRQNMIPTALSQVTETLVRIVTVLAFAYMMLPYGISYAAAGAMVGVLAGEIAAMLVLLLLYKRDFKQQKPAASLSAAQTSSKRKPAFGGPSNFKQLLRLALPVTGSKLVGSGSYFLESILIVQSLAAAGVATAMATAQYGALQGMVIPVLMLPSALTYSLAVSLIPSLSEAAAKGDMKTIHMRLHQSLRLALVTGAPFSILMYVLAEPICTYMYAQPEVGAMLRLMAPAALFIYLQAPLQAALQALDKPGAALINTLIGSAVKLSLIYWLASRPEFGILGAIVAITVNIMLVTILHGYSVARLLQFKMSGLDFVKAGISMAGAGLVSALLMKSPWIEDGLSRFLAACAAGFMLYLVLALLTRLIDRQDFFRILWLSKKFVK